MRKDISDVSTCLRINKKREDNIMGKVVIMDHPLIQHKIGILRRKGDRF